MCRVAVVLLCALAALGPASPAGAVVGGTETTIDRVPWQVAVLPDGWLCGGSILDATHVVTAAHCTMDGSVRPFAPSEITVVAASTRFDGSEAGSQLRAVSAISRHPNYEDGYAEGLPTRDVAVLTLTTPLDLSAAGAAPVALGDTGRLSLWDGLLGDRAQISGWGITEHDQLSARVRTATVPVLTDGECGQRWGADYLGSVMLCGSTDSVDTCGGDSGGPAVVLEDERPVLAGITSFGGAECAVAAVPGVYTEVAGVRSFVEPTATAPQRLADPGLSGTARAGEVLTCGHGRWTGSPVLGFQFVRTDSGPAVLLPSDGTRRYRLRADDVGTTVACRVTAANAAGSAVANSPSTPRVAASTTPPAGPAAPAPVAPPAPSAAPGPVAAPPPPDRAAPTSRLSLERCSRTRCTFRAVVADAAPSSGLRALHARLITTVRAPCPRGRRRSRCLREVATVVAAQGSGRVRRIAVARSAAGATLAVVAEDVAGNRQATPARRRVPRAPARAARS